MKTRPGTQTEQEVVEAYIASHGPMPMWAEQREGQDEATFLGYAESYADFVAAFGTAEEPRRPRARKDVDMSPEAVAARAEARRREGEALAYVAAYTGSWGLPLDIRADRRWGTKYMRLTDGQVEALLAGKARDEERRARFDAWAREHADVVVWLANHVGTSSFLDDLFASLGRFGHLTDNQLAAVERQMQPPEPKTPLAPSAPITEGMYQSPSGDIFKVQHTRADHTRLYAKRLVVREGSRTGSFEYEQGGIRLIRPEWRMTIEQAEAFGKLYGMCCVCGAELTDETSIARGIGPVCAEKVTR